MFMQSKDCLNNNFIEIGNDIREVRFWCEGYNFIDEKLVLNSR
jgi:hypothetical protein